MFRKKLIEMPKNPDKKAETKAEAPLKRRISRKNIDNKLYIRPALTNLKKVLLTDEEITYIQC